MVSKCANPECSASFRYFHEGKLFRLETKSGHDRRHELGDDTDMAKPIRRIEFYWLCEACAEKMTLASHKGGGVSVRPAEAARATAA